MKNRVFKTAAASAAVLVASLMAPTAAFAAAEPGVPYSDQLNLGGLGASWEKPGSNFLVGQSIVPTAGGSLFGIDIWVAGIGPDDTPDDPVLKSAAVYDITGLAYEEFDLVEETLVGKAEDGAVSSGPDEDGRFRLSLTFPDLPYLSEDSRYLLVLEHDVDDDGKSKASYRLGVFSGAVAEPGMSNREGVWAGLGTYRLWHEVFLVDPIVPEIPTLVESDTCDVPATVLIPEQEGVEYNVVENGYTHIVTAVVADELVVKPDADLGPWTFDVTPVKCEEEGGDTDNGDGDAGGAEGGDDGDDTEDGGTDVGGGESDDTDGGTENGTDTDNGDSNGDVEDDLDVDVSEEDAEKDAATSDVDEDLPPTGVDSGGLIAVGLAVIALGAIATLWSRRVTA